MQARRTNRPCRIVLDRNARPPNWSRSRSTLFKMLSFYHVPQFRRGETEADNAQAGRCHQFQVAALPNLLSRSAPQVRCPE